MRPVARLGAEFFIHGVDEIGGNELDGTRQ
jgi:hypothetical protein